MTIIELLNLLLSRWKLLFILICLSLIFSYVQIQKSVFETEIITTIKFDTDSHSMFQSKNKAVVRFKLELRSAEFAESFHNCIGSKISIVQSKNTLSKKIKRFFVSGQEAPIFNYMELSHFIKHNIKLQQIETDIIKISLWESSNDLTFINNLIKCYISYYSKKQDLWYKSMVNTLQQTSDFKVARNSRQYLNNQLDELRIDHLINKFRQPFDVIIKPHVRYGSRRPVWWNIIMRNAALFFGLGVIITISRRKVKNGK
jgi:hypothetical protein